MAEVMTVTHKTHDPRVSILPPHLSPRGPELVLGGRHKLKSDSL